MNEKQVLKHTVSYDEGLLKALKDPKEARAYLEVALDECEASGEIDGYIGPARRRPSTRGCWCIGRALWSQPRTSLLRAFKSQ